MVKCVKDVRQHGAALGSAVAPRVVWSYWDKGFDQLSSFRKRCVRTWFDLNPGWHFLLLDASSVWDYLEVGDLPRQWKDMYVAFQADAVRLGLLAKYGGLWIDPATICLKPFDWWIYEAIVSEDRIEGIGAFYFSAWGVEQGRSAEYVENWLLAARRGHPMILRWQALFNGFWNDVVVGTLDPLGLPEHDMFKNVDLSFLQRFGHDMRAYLVMHACFKKMIDEDGGMRRIWRQEMVLLRADENALWHLNEAGVQWQVERAQKWLAEDEAWVAHVLLNCHILKFTKQFATFLDERFEADSDSSIAALFRAVAFEAVN